MTDEIQETFDTFRDSVEKGAKRFRGWLEKADAVAGPEEIEKARNLSRQPFHVWVILDGFTVELVPENLTKKEVYALSGRHIFKKHEVIPALKPNREMVIDFDRQLVLLIQDETPLEPE